MPDETLLQRMERVQLECADAIRDGDLNAADLRVGEMAALTPYADTVFGAGSSVTWHRDTEQLRRQIQQSRINLRNSRNGGFFGVKMRREIGIGGYE